MVTSSIQESNLTERAFEVAIDLFAEINRGESLSETKAKKISKIFGLVFLPQESMVQVVKWKLYNWCQQIKVNRINQAEIESVLPELESISTKVLSAIA